MRRLRGLRNVQMRSRGKRATVETVPAIVPARRCTAGERSSAHSVAGSTTAMAQDVIGQLVSRQCRSTRQWSALAYAATAARSCASMCATAASAASRCRQSQRRSAAKAGGSVRDRILACRSSGRSCSRGGPAVTCECAQQGHRRSVVNQADAGGLANFAHLAATHQETHFTMYQVGSRGSL